MGINTSAWPGSRRQLLRQFLRLTLAACGAAVAAGSAAQPAVAVAPPPQQVAAEVTALLAARINPAGPGVAVLVARGDTLLFRGARGMASIELGVPLSADHVFRIGSVTKQFAAATLLQQVDAGRATLNDPLSAYLPDFPGGPGITLAQLLNHTSGVKSYTGVPGYIGVPARRELNTAELVASFQNLPVDFTPGVSWAYNNSGYVLVGAVIEALTKQPWPRAVADLLRPLNLAHTRAGDDRAVVPGMAEGYSVGPDNRTTRALWISMTQPHAAGALLSTVDDLWRWNLALHGGRVLKAESYRRMTTPEGAPAAAAGYGYGLQTARWRGQAMLEHNGGIPGFLSTLMWLPGPQLTVVVLRNADGPGLAPGPLAREIAAIAIGQP
jgi:CubicO group peptidase (beta-lactamase class C family)